jgi:hypothetical protein
VRQHTWNADLKSTASISEFAQTIENSVDQFLADSVVTTSVCETCKTQRMSVLKHIQLFAASSLPLIMAVNEDVSNRFQMNASQRTFGVKQATESAGTNRVDNIGFQIDIDGSWPDYPFMS